MLSASVISASMISANAVLTGSYDYGEVARSILIAIAGSYASLDLAGRVTVASGSARSRWLAGGAIVMGIGIWEMHFKGMLALRLPVPVAYHWPTVLLSFAVAVITSGIALIIVSRPKMGPVELWTGSLIMGSGIAALHYIDMAAMRLPAVCRFDVRIVILSILLAIAFSFVALTLAFGLREETRGTPWRRIASAVVMGAAISAMHYTGMASASFIASPVIPNLSHTVNISPLSNAGVSMVTLLVLGAAIVTSAADRQARSEARRVNERLEQCVVERTRELEAVNRELRRENAERQRAEDAVRRSEDHLRLVIDTTPAMLHSVRPDGYVDFFNKRWLEYVGASLEDISGWQWTNVIHPKDVEDVLVKWRTSLATGAPFEDEARLRRADGEYRLMLLRKVPLRDEAGTIVKWYGSATDIEDRKRAEQELRQAEEHIRAILEYSPNWIFLKDTEGRYLLVNREIERVFGISHEQIKGKTDSEIFPPQQAAEYRANDLKVLRAGLAMEFEETTLLEDGPHTSIVHKFPLFDTHGNTYAIGGVATDITERKRAEEARRYSEEQYRTVVETATDAVVSIGEDSKILFVNPATTKIFGYDTSELIGRPLMMLMPESLRKLHQVGFRRYLATGQRHLNWQGTELTGLRKNGQEFPVEVSFGEMTSHGRKVFTGFIRDISKKKRAEDELRKQKEVFQTIFEDIPVMIGFVGKNGRVELVNPEWERTMGWTLLEIQEPNKDVFAEFFPDPEYRQSVQNSIAASTGEWTNFKVKVKDGRLIDVAAAFVRLSDGSSLGIGKDITEWRQTQSALQEAQDNLIRVTRAVAMGGLAAAIAHEVNQPLAAIVTNANFCLRELSGEGKNPERLREAIAEIVNDGVRASAIISRIRALLAKGAPEKTELDMNEIIREVTSLLRNELTRNRVSVRTDLDRDLPRVSGDRVQLQQVLINLVMNGMEAMRSLTNRPRDLLIRSSRYNNQALIQVQDSGEGLSAQQAEHIFEPFFTTKAEGIGMGLTISRSIIESHGGRLWAESNHNGALFQFTLPTQ